MEPLLDELPDGLKRWAPPPRRLRYARCGSAGACDLPRVVLEEEWGAPERQGDRVVFRRTTREVGAEGPGRVIEDALVGYGPDGLVDLGVFVDGGFSPYEPPQVVLPGNPVVGARWSAEHARGERKSKRTVELVACPQHKRCLLSVAEIRRPEGTLILRSHFADGEGWAGYDALVQAANRPSVRTWTEAVSVTVRTRGD